MGMYVNPGSAGFAEINDPDYVDKTGLIRLVNKRIGKAHNLVCFTRPRLFGKTWDAKMLTAYYDCSCSSHALFDDKQIAASDDYEAHLNSYNVICLDITGFLSRAEARRIPLREIPDMIEKALWMDLVRSGFTPGKSDDLNDFLIRCVEHGRGEEEKGKPFLFIIDDWDAVIREAGDDPDAQAAYLSLLQGWFKNGNFTPKVVVGAYLTGILPIGREASLSDFREYTIIWPGEFAPYVGFTEDQVRRLCEQFGCDFATMKAWYNGYSFKGKGSVYNPHAVMEAIENDAFDFYWSKSASPTSLISYISKDFRGLARAIAELVGGNEVTVNTVGFANDLTTFHGKDNVLTSLIHLGYLAYDAERKKARIPNEEIRQEFQRTVHAVQHTEMLRRLEESEKLFEDTIHGCEEAVAAGMDQVCADDTGAIFSDREESLRAVIRLAYFTYRDHYERFEELPGGEGLAAIAYIPKKECDWPVLLIELKGKDCAESVINQILNGKNTYGLESFGRPILLAGISYTKDTQAGVRKHTCRIVVYTC